MVGFGSTFIKVLTFNTKDEEVKQRYVTTIIEDIRHSLVNGLGVGDEVKKSDSWKPLEEKLAEFDIELPLFHR